jgi:CO dehydrogenase/acetyl-CoA synthase delta subunit
LAIGLTALATALGLFGGVDFALSVAAGGTIALVNYSALSWMVDRIAQPRRRRGTKLAVLGFGLRYALLGVALYVIFAFWNVNVVAVSLGLSAPVAAIFFEWVFEAYEGRVQG